jgi:hypothetical protein
MVSTIDMLHPSPETTWSHGPTLIGAKKKWVPWWYLLWTSRLATTDCLKKPAYKHFTFLQWWFQSRQIVMCLLTSECLLYVFVLFPLIGLVSSGLGLDLSCFHENLGFSSSSLLGISSFRQVYLAGSLEFLTTVVIYLCLRFLRITTLCQIQFFEFWELPLLTIKYHSGNCMCHFHNQYWFIVGQFSVFMKNLYSCSEK